MDQAPVESGQGPPCSNGTGVLYVVATPIGNLEDISLRASRILAMVDLIAAEDTRQTRKLLSHLGVTTPLVGYYRGKERQRARGLLDRLARGENVALVSDAGTPAISDPGTHLVRQAREAGITIVPIPGASALTAAVSVSGMAEHGFVFFGFLPAKRNARLRELERLADQQLPLIFYEAPHRLVACLRDCHTVFGDRQVFVAREITKMYEEQVAGALADVATQFEKRSKVKGECVVIVAGAPAAAGLGREQTRHELVCCRQAGLSVRDAVSRVAGLSALSRSAVYGMAVTIWDAEEPPAAAT